MKKDEFLKQFKEKLTDLPREEQEEAIRYYTEYFEDAGEENEEKVIKELVSPTFLAAQIMMDSAIRENSETKSLKKSISVIKIGLLAFFGIPIGIPLALAIIILLFSGIMTWGMLIVSAFILDFALVAGGIVYIIIAVLLFAKSISTGLVFIGIGFIMLGMGIIFHPVFINICKKSFVGIGNLIKKMLNKFIKHPNKGVKSL